jgi:hypothetical protein
MVFVTGIVVGHEVVQSLHATLVPAMFAADELLVGNRDVVLDLLVIFDHSLLLITLDDELVPLVHHQDQLLQRPVKVTKYFRRSTRTIHYMYGIVFGKRTPPPPKKKYVEGKYI